MRHPLWILNSALLFLLVIALLFVLFSREPLPIWEGITPLAPAAPLQKKASEVSLRKIYENDLFDTYQQELTPPEKKGFIAPLPPAPMPRPVQIPQEPSPQFLDPLNIVLKGIIIVLDDDTKNRAMITDTKTNRESIYKVGDIIEDAQLIKIFSKKVIFLRSNGQQEVLYLRPKDAQMDPAYAAIVNNFKDLVQEIADNTYIINPNQFTQHIKSLGQFIDTLQLTTEYKQGKSVGRRVGIIENNSLGAALGFKPGDVLITINELPTTDSNNLFKIYKNILNMKTKDSITVELLRDGSPMTITYTLEDFGLTPDHQAPQPNHPTAPPAQVQQAQLDILKEQYKFAPTLQQIRAKERDNMIKKGRYQRNSLTSKFTE